MILFWFVDAGLDAAFHYDEGFWHVLVINKREILFRLVASFFLVAFGLLVDFVTAARQREKTALQKARASIGLEKARADAIIAAMGEGLSIQDVDFRILFQNQRNKEMIGGSHEGEHCYQAYEQRDAVCDGCPMALSFADGEIHTAVRSGQTAAGPIQVEITTSPLQDDSGKIIAGIEIVRDVSDARKTAEKLQHERDFIFAVMNTVDALVVVLDREGRIIRFNRACETLTGFTYKEVLGRHVWDFLLIPEDIEPVKRVFASLQTGQQASTFENYWLTRAGERRLISWSNSILFDQDGVVEHLIATGIDVTKTRRAEIEIEQHSMTLSVLNKLLHLSLENLALPELLERFIHYITSLPWLILEPKGVVFLVEEGRDRLVMQAQRNLVEPLLTGCAHVPFGYCLCGRAVLGSDILFVDCVDETHDIAYEGMKPHGHYCVPIVSAAKKPLGVFTVYTTAGRQRDKKVEEVLLAAASVVAAIIERKRAEEALRENEEKYRAINDSAHDAIIMMDEQGAIAHWNPAAEKIFGYTAPEVIGINLHALLSPRQYQAAARRGMEKFKASGEGFLLGKSFEITGLRKDGSEFPLELSLARLRSGEAWWAVGMIRDITLRKASEEEKLRLEAKFLQAQKMEAVGQLAGGVAHDFNNLLTGIIGFAEIVLDDLETDHPLRTEVKEIVDLSQRAAKLTRQLLAFSRRQSLNPEYVKINELVSHLLKMLKRLIGEHIELEFIPDPDLGPVHADPGQIEQILANLTINARDAMPDGGRIVIRTTGVTPEAILARAPHQQVEIPTGSYVSFSVEDTGCGMDEQVLTQIFEPFFSTKAVGRGSGLGLSTVYGIIKQHHGFIWVTSALGQGSTFEVWLPVFLEDDEKVVKDEDKKIVASKAGGTILLVEDEEPVRRITNLMLGKLGYNVLCAANAGEAEEIFDRQAGAIDLLLTDVIMPGKNGRELYESLATLKPDLKVLYMSGYMDDIVARKGVVREGDSFLSKPFSSQEIAMKVQLAMAQD